MKIVKLETVDAFVAVDLRGCRGRALSDWRPAYSKVEHGTWPGQ